jgi:hypothetical protein
MNEWTHANVIAVREKFHNKLPDYVINYINRRKLVRALTTNARITRFLFTHLDEYYITSLLKLF